MEHFQDYLKGRGAQINPDNRFSKQAYDTGAGDGLDEPVQPAAQTQFFYDHPKTIINKVSSPDIPLKHSINPYQGCEHGCVYCYARNTHAYWGFSAGLDFESKIIVKSNTPALLRKALNRPSWKPEPIMFSGNTDCYQPIERKMLLTRQCLEIFREYGQPVGMITKNSLILRDVDILSDLAANDLVHVFISITTLEESLRRVMEPRTATAARRLAVVEALTKAGVPTGVMIGPVIPGLNNHEIPAIVQAAAKHGARACGYTLVRLNGDIGLVFEDWIRKNFPDRAEKVLNQIKACHGGQLNDSVYGRRMRGSGPIADSISTLFQLAKKQHLKGREMPPYRLDIFRRPDDRQLSLF
ncbi:MAG: PA0069 family radical SAM protein [Bacteroidetes bacterium]|nr:MAG: PA0069 family radical SAM protein [Bacteroidota bacterium]